MRTCAGARVGHHHLLDRPVVAGYTGAEAGWGGVAAGRMLEECSRAPRSTGLLRYCTSRPPGSGIVGVFTHCDSRDLSSVIIIARPARPPGRSGDVVADGATTCGAAHRAGAVRRNAQQVHLGAKVLPVHSWYFVANAFSGSCNLNCEEDEHGSSPSPWPATSLSVEEAARSTTDRGFLHTCPGAGVIPRAGGRKDCRRRNGNAWLK